MVVPALSLVEAMMTALPAGSAATRMAVGGMFVVTLFTVVENTYVPSWRMFPAVTSNNANSTL